MALVRRAIWQSTVANYGPSTLLCGWGRARGATPLVHSSDGDLRATSLGKPPAPPTLNGSAAESVRHGLMTTPAGCLAARRSPLDRSAALPPAQRRPLPALLRRPACCVKTTAVEKNDRKTTRRLKATSDDATKEAARATWTPAGFVTGGRARLTEGADAGQEPRTLSERRPDCRSSSQRPSWATTGRAHECCRPV